MNKINDLNDLEIGITLLLSVPYDIIYIDKVLKSYTSVEVFCESLVQDAARYYLNNNGLRSCDHFIIDRHSLLGLLFYE